MSRSRHFVPKDLRLAHLPRNGETIAAADARDELQRIIKQFNMVASQDVIGMAPASLARWRAYGDDIAAILCMMAGSVVIAASEDKANGEQIPLRGAE